MVTRTSHIGIHEGADGRTDVDDVMAIKPNFLTSMGYHIFLTMVLRARAELRYQPIFHVSSNSFTAVTSSFTTNVLQVHSSHSNKSIKCFVSFFVHQFPIELFAL